jgi:hypothetical protein
MRNQSRSPPPDRRDRSAFTIANCGFNENGIYNKSNRINEPRSIQMDAFLLGLASLVSRIRTWRMLWAHFFGWRVEFTR